MDQLHACTDVFALRCRYSQPVSSGAAAAAAAAAAAWLLFGSVSGLFIIFKIRSVPGESGGMLSD